MTTSIDPPEGTDTGQDEQVPVDVYDDEDHEDLPSVVTSRYDEETVIAALSQDPAIAAVLDAAADRCLPRIAALTAYLTVMSSLVDAGVALPDPATGKPSASVGVYLMLVGKSTAGKTRLLKEVTSVLGDQAAERTFAPSTAEGAHDYFCDLVEEDDGDKKRRVWQQQRYNALLDLDEAQVVYGKHAQDNTVSVNMRRFLRQAFTSPRISAQALSKRNPSGADSRGSSPRIALDHVNIAALAATQPGTVATMLGLDDEGDHQRWLFLPLNDPGAQQPVAKPRLWPLPNGRFEQGLVELAAPVAAETHRNIQLVTSGDDEAVGHEILARLGLAAMLGWLRGHPGSVDVDDWRLSGVLVELNYKVRDFYRRKIFDEAISRAAARWAEQRFTPEALKRIAQGGTVNRWAALNPAAEGDQRSARERFRDEVVDCAADAATREY